MSDPHNVPVNRVERLCLEQGLRMTDHRRLIAQVLSQADDHPMVDSIYRRVIKLDPQISIATVYRTIRLFEEAGVVTRHDFRDNSSRYEPAPDTPHDHLIDLKTGRIVEFHDPDIERLMSAIARRLGYRLIDHRLELYGWPEPGVTGHQHAVS